MDFEKQNRRDGSLFAPIVLIAIGVFWLLSNLGILPGIDWGRILRLWPLLLIFWGLNLIFRSAPRPFNTLLSALLGVIAVGLFVIVVLFGESLPLTLGSTAPTIVSDADVSVPLEDSQSASVTIDTSLVPAQIYALSDSDKLLDGQVSYIGDLILDAELGNSEAVVRLDTKAESGWFLDPSTWNQFGEDDQWEIGLTPRIPLDLSLDTSAGAGHFRLSELQLENFELDGGSGGLTILLPDGSYDASIDLGSGSSTWTLPASGAGEYKFDSGSGSVTMMIPQGMEAQIEIERGSGSFSADSRFELVNGDSKDGTWQTPGYPSAENRLDISIDSGSGSVTVRLPTGR